jgi:hypothetical protein
MDFFKSHQPSTLEETDALKKGASAETDASLFFFARTTDNQPSASKNKSVIS